MMRLLYVEIKNAQLATAKATVETHWREVKNAPTSGDSCSIYVIEDEEALFRYRTGP